MFEISQKLPRPVVYRLPQYLTHVRELKQDGLEWISSHKLADDLGLTSSTVRQDLSKLHMHGVSKRGYRIVQLEKALSDVLGAGRVHNAVIVGAGYLGTALALHGGLAEQGFKICGIFDSDPELMGAAVGSLRVQSMETLDYVVGTKCKAEIGIIAVPASSAQSVADLLIDAGVRGLLNLAYTRILVPPGVALMDARIIANLQQLAYVIRNRNGKPAVSSTGKSSGNRKKHPASNNLPGGIKRDIKI